MAAAAAAAAASDNGENGGVGGVGGDGSSEEAQYIVMVRHGAGKNICGKTGCIYIGDWEMDKMDGKGNQSALVICKIGNSTPSLYYRSTRIP